MITCFSFTLNGWVNYNFPVRSIVGITAMPFKLINAPSFAYAEKAHAEAGMMPNPAIAAKPYKWAKHLPKLDIE